MAKQKTKTEQQQQRFGDSMIDEVILIIIVVICIVVLISLLTKKMGILGTALGSGLKGLLGISSILLPLSVIIYCCWLLGSEQKKNREVRVAGIALFLVTISALAHVINPIETSIMANLAEIIQSYYQEGEFTNGGVLGGILGGIVKKAFGKIGAGIIWSAILLISLIMSTGKSFFKGVKNKKKQYHERRQQMQTSKVKEIPLQVVPKVPKTQPKPQPKPQIKPQPQPKSHKKMQKNQNTKNKAKQKGNFNILLRADEGYNQNREEIPIVEAMVFQNKNKQEQTSVLEAAPKTPVIFDYGKTESEVLAEQQQNIVEQPYQQAPDMEVNEVNNVETQSDIQTDAEKEKREEMRRRRIEREKLRELERQQQKLLELERQQQQQLQQQNQISSDKQNIDSKQELTQQQNTEEQNQTNTVRYMIFEEEQNQPLEQAEEVKSDTEDIADVLALLNSIHFEEEVEKVTQNANENTQDIMEIIADWAEQEQEIPQSNGLSLVLAEDDTEQIEEIAQKKTEEVEAEDTIIQKSDEISKQQYVIEQSEVTETLHTEEINDNQQKKEQIQNNTEQTENLQQQQNINEITIEQMEQQQMEQKQEIEQIENIPQIEETPTQQINETQEIEEIPQQLEEIEPLEETKQLKEIEQTKKEYIFPPFDLLSRKQAIQSSESKSEMLVNAKKLETTLKSFGVDAKVIQINKGPTVTRYELSPSQGVKVSKIVNLADDIALNLAASGIRIEAPIPGKAAVGIEVPNKEAQSVSLRSVLESETFQKFPSKLAFALGEDITGQPIVTDIAKMPHLLIAGATGSGKSVCINTLITSILYKAKPEEVKLLLVDPKVVELSIYNGIPHLLIPVVTDPKKASAALNWAVREMLERYNDFAENGVRDIKGYNAMKKEKGESDFMPQIVIIIDELADLMMAAPGEVEDSICRLAQMARAAGMHLIIATQRPSVDVITGVIKANIPSRLAFAVSSGIDSRTILDMTGAEKLLGKGDMLFYPQGMSKPVRIQGAFLSDKEVESIVQFVKTDNTKQYDKEMIDKITATAKTDTDTENEDEFFDSAVELVIQKQKASTSMLQRQFRIGYNRAARLMEALEQKGIVGQEEGSRPRKVLLTKQQWEETTELE
ncbi:DNA translocase FtsK [Clostridium sp. ASF356]|nr:DNA translocase FtsK [Clostridium sp. MD294]NDO46498.1 DNA translocase FtsK [Clostridium sp. MD294]USF29072.1 hypothetical protein C820_000455 [Clostridium sp. MD294]